MQTQLSTRNLIGFDSRINASSDCRVDAAAWVCYKVTMLSRPLTKWLAVGAGMFAILLAALAAEKLVPLEIKLPPAPFASEPVIYDPSGRWEKMPDKPLPPIMVPPGTTNLSQGKPVRSSDPRPLMGALAEITDGKKECVESRSELEVGKVVLHRGKQWIQIDLQASHPIYAIVVWRHLSRMFGYHAVVVQVADDADCTQNVRTLFNNDYENLLGFGAGTNLLYVETFEGKLIEAKGARARYVRLYSQGNTRNELNGYNEVEVYGQ